MNTIINDVVNDDGTVIRTTTITFPNGDTDVRTHTYTADQYQAIQTNLQNQIVDLQSQLATVQTNITQVQTILSNKNQSNIIK